MIITIGREFGSGGRELGKRLAESLGIAYYDREILEEIAKKTSLAYEYVQNIIEKKPIIYYPISIGHSFDGYNSVVSIDESNIYAKKEEVIKELASKSDCVIVGRCADYILRDQKPFRIFVYSDMQSKIERCRKKGAVDEKTNDRKLAKIIKNIDKQRAEYYEFYTSLKWGDKSNYDLMINSSSSSIKKIEEGVVAMLKEYDK